MSPRVIHTAQALVDEVVVVAVLPRRGGNVMASAHSLYAGGAVNILIAAARSGADAVHAGAHGTGPNGDLVRAALAAEGIRVACAPIAEGIALASAPIAELDTGICFVMIEPSAERTFVTTQGAERRITPESLDASQPAPGDLVCVSGYSMVGLTRDPLLAWVERLPTGVVVVLDPGAAFADLDTALQDRLLARTTVWTSNAEEARDLTGIAAIEESGRHWPARRPTASRSRRSPPDCPAPGWRLSETDRVDVRSSRTAAPPMCQVSPSKRSTPTAPVTPTPGYSRRSALAGRGGSRRRGGRMRPGPSRSPERGPPLPPRPRRSTRSSPTNSRPDRINGVSDA